MLRAVLVSTALCSAAALCAATVARAQDGQGYVDYRQNLMRSVGANMAAISDVLKHGLPLQKNVPGHASNLQSHGGQIELAFERRVVEGKTDAKPAIWENRTGFLEALAEFRKQADLLVQVANQQDMAALGAQVREVGKACSGCHRQFRKPEEESYKNQ
jgi:cytochrome c556